MFGKLKESVLSSLESTMNNKGEKDFKSEFAEYIKVLKEDNVLREFNETYNLLNDLKFDDELMALAFVDESIKRLKEIDGTSTDKLSKLTEETIDISGTINHSIDELVFNKNLSIVDKVEHKTKLVRNVIKNSVNGEELNESIDSITSRLNNKVSQLNEEQVKALNIFADNDESKINEYYATLINEVSALVNKTVNESNDIIIVKKLLSVNTRLNEMSNNKPTLEAIDDILDLKKTFI